MRRRSINRDGGRGGLGHSRTNCTRNVVALLTLFLTVGRLVFVLRSSTLRGPRGKRDTESLWRAKNKNPEGDGTHSILELIEISQEKKWLPRYYDDGRRHDRDDHDHASSTGHTGGLPMKQKEVIAQTAVVGHPPGEESVGQIVAVPIDNSGKEDTVIGSYITTSRDTGDGVAEVSSVLLLTDDVRAEREERETRWGVGMKVLIFTMDSLEERMQLAAKGGPAGEIKVRKRLTKSLLEAGVEVKTRNKKCYTV